MTQTTLFDIHSRESNPESEVILNANKKHFSRQCQILFDAMMRGEILTSMDCVVKYNILDGRRRWCDLEENGVRISELMRDGKYKQRYFSEEDKLHNKQFTK